MQLLIVASLWQYHHPESNGILDKIDIDSRVDKEVLWDSLLVELGELECVDRNSECFYRHMVAFFRKWDLPLVQLLNTLEYKYNPLENVNLQVQRNLSREVVRDLGRDIIGTLTSAITRAIDEKRTYSDTQSGKDTRAITDNIDVTESGKDSRTIEDAIDTTQTNSHTDSHYVSAYDQTTPTNADTYDNRDSGNWSTTTDTDETKTDVLDWSKKSDSDETKSDVLDWNSVKSATDNKTTGSDDNRQDNTSQNTKENESTDTGENEGTTKVGVDRITYQELTDSQRRTVMFNIYNWIIDKFAKEFMIQMW